MKQPTEKNNTHKKAGRSMCYVKQARKKQENNEKRKKTKLVGRCVV